MLQYSIDQVTLVWLGNDLMEGIAEGTSLQETRNASSWSMKMGGRGKGTRVYNPDRSGTFALTVDQESQLHQTLKSIARADRISRDKVGPMVLTDNSSSERIAFLNAFIATDPDESRGTESATFVWTFIFEDKKTDTPEKLTNVVNAG